MRVIVCQIGADRDDARMHVSRSTRCCRLILSIMIDYYYYYDYLLLFLSCSSSTLDYHLMPDGSPRELTELPRLSPTLTSPPVASPPQLSNGDSTGHRMGCLDENEQFFFLPFFTSCVLSRWRWIGIASEIPFFFSFLFWYKREQLQPVVFSFLCFFILFR